MTNKSMFSQKNIFVGILIVLIKNACPFILFELIFVDIESNPQLTHQKSAPGLKLIS